LRSCYDDPDWIAYQTLCTSIYQNHPYGRSIVGNETCLAQLTPNQMRCFHRTHYQPENICIAIIGGIEQEQATKIIRQSFAQFPIPSESPLNIVEAEPPIVEIRRSQVYLPHLEHSRLLMGWMGPGCDRLEDAFGLDLISIILAGGRCSRLVRQLREETQIVLDIDSNFSLQRDSSLFTIGAYLSNPQIDAIEGIICTHLEELQNHPVTPEELHRAQQLLANEYFFYGNPQPISGTIRILSHPEIGEISHYLSPNYPKFPTPRSTASRTSVPLPRAICYYSNATL
jgi:zinc protease